MGLYPAQAFSCVSFSQAFIFLCLGDPVSKIGIVIIFILLGYSEEKAGAC